MLLGGKEKVLLKEPVDKGIIQEVTCRKVTESNTRGRK